MFIQTVLYSIFLTLLLWGVVFWWVSVFMSDGSDGGGDHLFYDYEAYLGQGSNRVTVAVGVAGSFPYRVGVNGRVFAFANSVRLSLWLDHLDDYLDFSKSESERELHSPISLGYGVSAAHPALRI